MAVSSAARKPDSTLANYKAILIAVVIFLVVDIGLLAINFIASLQIAANASEINLAGRQRMLSQRMSKVVHAIEATTAQTKPVVETDLIELGAASRLFDSTLNAFDKGGTVAGANNANTTLAAQTSPKAIAAIKAGSAIWASWKPLIDTLLAAAPKESPETVVLLAAKVRSTAVPLLGTMNDLTIAMEEDSAALATKLKIAEIIGIVLALLLFALVVMLIVRKVRTTDAALIKAGQETEDILNTVGEGLFLVKADFTIGQQQSKKVEAILSRPATPGADFLAMMASMVNPATNEAAKDYLELLFAGRVKESLMNDLNPLTEFEVNTPAEGKRHLSMNFNRVMRDGQFQHVLVTVQDVTERVRLGDEIKEAKERAKNEMAVLLQLLKVPPHTLANYLRNADESLNRLNEVLRATGASPETYRETINDAYRRIHTLKGEAASLGISTFEQACHDFETEIGQARSRQNIGGEDLIGLSVALTECFNRLRSLQAIGGKLTEYGKGQSSLAIAGARPGFVTPATEEFAEQMRSLANRIAGDLRKTVLVSTDIADINRLSDNHQRELKDVLVQLLRNAVVHGIELPSVRQERSKPAAGTIVVTVKATEAGKYEATVRDDGDGIKPENIRMALVRNNVMNADAAALLAPRDLVAKIFEPGFSTASEVTKDAGRGVGLDVVKAKIEGLGGRLGLSSAPDQFTQFTVRVSV
jgi:two-component system, chemotaxis family, sensor kinase CheA